MIGFALRTVRNVGLVAAVVGLVACGNSQSFNPTGPSVLPQGSLNGRGGESTVRWFNAAILPTSIPAGTSAAFTLTITNCSSAAPCDPTHATTTNQTIKSATVAVPSGFTVTTPITVSPLGEFTATLVAGVIQVVKVASNDLTPGESLTLSFSATAPCANTSDDWTTHAYNGADFTTDYGIVPEQNGQPKVAVTGTCGAAVCRLGPGFWKNHGPAAPGHNANVWPVVTMLLGTHSYSDVELQSILDQPSNSGNGLVILARQLIAARLNIANGADGSSITAALAAADLLIGSLVIPPVGADSVDPNLIGSVKDALEAFNEGGCSSGSGN